MGKFKPFLFGTILGAGLAVCALQFHIVQSHDGFRVIPRTPQASLGLAYADVRNWGAEQWADRPELVQALIAHGSTDLVTGSVAESVVNSVTSDNSTLDQLRSFLNESEDSGATEIDASSFLSLPADSGTDDSDEDSFLPFSVDSVKSESDAKPREENGRRSAVARRETPDIDDVFSAGVSGLNSFDAQEDTRESYGSFGSSHGTAAELRDADDSSYRSSSNTHSSSTGLSATEETELLEEMLFGNDADSGSDLDSDEGFGVFEDITSKLESRADEALNRARNGLQEEAERAVSDTSNTLNRYVRDRVRESVPKPIAGMFAEDSPSAFPSRSSFGSSTSSADSDVPAAIRAIREGFDPFVE